MLSIRENTVIYGANEANIETAINEALKVISPTELGYSRRIVFNGKKVPHAINVSDVHYEVDLWTLSLDGISGFFTALDHIKDSANDSQNSLVVFHSAGRVPSRLLRAISLHSGTHPSSTVNLTFWIATTSLSALPLYIRQRYVIRSVPCGCNDSSWRARVPQSIAEALMKEIELVEPRLCKVRQILYRLNSATLSVHDLAWPLLRSLERRLRELGRPLTHQKLLDYTERLIAITNDYEHGYRPIFYLERLVVETAIVYHGASNGASSSKDKQSMAKSPRSEKRIQEKITC